MAQPRIVSFIHRGDLLSEVPLYFRQRVRELSASHDVEMESLATQHKEHSHMLLLDFNNAKALFVNKISQLETQ